MRKISHDGLARFSECDGVARHRCERLHAREGQGGKKLVKVAELRRRAFVLQIETVMVPQIDAVPDVAVADGAMKTGGEVTAGTNDSPGTATHFVGVMYLLFGSGITQQIFVAVL